MFAALSIVLWAAQFAGWLPRPCLAGPLWHAHEMLFGFTLAVVVGFLLTAGRNWSNRPTPSGASLAALAALWVAGRVLVLTPFGWAAAITSAAFPIAAAAALAVPFWASRNRRNYFFVGLLVMMGVADLAIHLSQLGVIDLPAWLGVQLALDVVLFIMAVMGGRVIPMFTNNGVPDAGAVRHVWVERAALGSVLALLAADLLQLQLQLHGAALTAQEQVLGLDRFGRTEQQHHPPQGALGQTQCDPNEGDHSPIVPQPPVLNLPRDAVPSRTPFLRSTTPNEAAPQTDESYIAHEPRDAPIDDASPTQLRPWGAGLQANYRQSGCLFDRIA